MKLIAGLGNPGPRYVETRHNLGFRGADELARRKGLTFESSRADAIAATWRRSGAAGRGPDTSTKDADADEIVLVVKPLTFMNLSGHAIAELLRYYRIDLGDLLIICDDVNLPLGRLRARPGGSAGGHNGLNSIIEALADEGFARLRIGVGRGDARRDLADHVLTRIDPEERAAIDAAVLRAADAAEMFIASGIGAVMNAYNGEETREDPI